MLFFSGRGLHKRRFTARRVRDEPRGTHVARNLQHTERSNVEIRSISEKYVGV